ncbi:MBG domain-containing protein [Pediococcus siamensis]|uniref:MBG domain-containing protein n=1 Tax=Pediococcus siamensis TaxID=381829 RepID=UPI0039A0241C
MNKIQQKKRRRLLEDTGKLTRHYKMFKTTKGWCFAAISLLTFGMGIAFSQPNIQASDTTPVSVSASSETSHDQTTTSSASASSAAASTSSSASAVTTADTTSSSSSNTSEAASSASSSTSKASSSESSSSAQQVTSATSSSSAATSAVKVSSSESATSSSSTANKAVTHSVASATSEASSEAATSAVTVDSDGSSQSATSSTTSSEGDTDVTASSEVVSTNSAVSGTSSETTSYENGETLVDPTSADLAAAETAGSTAYAASGASQAFSAIAAASSAASETTTDDVTDETTLNFWTSDVDGSKNTTNTGSFGEDGLENYVYTDDPFQDSVTVATDDVDAAKTPVLAKGIYGTLKWYIAADEDGTVVLHLGSGSPITSTSTLPLGSTSPWAQSETDYKFTEISIDGDIQLVPEDTTGTTGARYLFANLNQVTTILNANKLNFAGVTDVRGMFSKDSALESLTGGTGDWDLSEVKDVGSMFASCSSLQNLDVTNWGMGSVTSASSMFNGASSLTELTGIENWSMANTTSCIYMFNGTSSLASLNLSGWNTSKVNNMQQMFSNMTLLTNLDLGDNWETSSVTTMYQMFAGDTALPTLDVSDWDTSSLTTAAQMFNKDKALSQLDFSNWDTSKVTNMALMLSGMTGLKQITFGTGFVTTNVTDGSVALPNTTDTVQWVNVGDGTTSEPQPTVAIKAYDGTLPDTYILGAVATATLSGTQKETYTGAQQKPDFTNYGVTLSDGRVKYTLQDGDIQLVSGGINAGEYEVELTDQGKENIENAVESVISGTYDISYGDSTATFEVEAAATTVTLSGSQQVAYNGQPQAPSAANYEITLPDGSTYTLKDSDLELTGDGENAGDYPVSLSASGKAAIEAALGSNYAVSYGDSTATFEVEAAATTVTLSGSHGKTYDGQAGTIDAGQYNVELSNGEKYTLQDEDLEFTISDPTDVNSYEVQLSAVGLAHLNTVDPNYQYTADSVLGKGIYTINKAKAIGSLTLDNSGKTFDGKPVSVIPTISFTTNGNTPIPSYELQLGDYEVVNNSANAKDYTIQLTEQGIANIEAANPNYTFALTDATATYTINKAAGTLVVHGHDGKTYDGKPGTLDTSKYSVKLSNGSTYTLQAGDLEFTVTNPTDANIYDVKLSATGLQHLNDADPNYYYTADAVSGVGTYTISPAETIPGDSTTDITVHDEVSNYGEDSPTFVIGTGDKITIPGNLTNEDFTFIDKTTGEVVDGVPTDVGNYEVTLNESGLEKVTTANPNYTIVDGSLISGTYTIKDVIIHSQITVNRTIHYTGAGSRTPHDVVQTLTYDVATSKATGVSTYTPQGSYAAVTTPTVTGFANSGSVSAQTPETSTTAPRDTVVTITYTPTNEITYSEISVTRTIHYMGAGNKTPHDVVETVIYKVATNQTTGEVSYTPQGVYEAVETPEIAGYRNSGDVAEAIPIATLTRPENSTVVVTYQASQPEEVGPGNGQTPELPENGHNGGQETPSQGGYNGDQQSEVSKPEASGKQTLALNSQVKLAESKSRASQKAPITAAVHGKLPQTDDNEETMATILGMSLLGGLLGLLGIKRRKHDEE